MSTEPSQPGAIGCGERFQLPAPGPLTLTARFSPTAGPDRQPLTGLVDVTGPAAVHGVGSGSAKAFLVRDGRVVSLPLPQDSMGVVWDLAPGANKTVPADVAVVSCEAGGTALTPGQYQLFVRIVLTSDDGGALESYGGPWPLQLQ